MSEKRKREERSDSEEEEELIPVKVNLIIQVFNSIF